MKKLLMIALLIGAIPAVAVGQTVSCEDCTHVLPVYYGEGGFIAETDADTEMVTYVATCEGVTRHGEVEADDGMVSMLLMGDLACHGDDEDNMFELGPVMDGGWYWITLETNSAVGGLVNKDILENETVDLADAGDGVMVMEGRGASLLTETATGRTGLLPNILPEMEMEPEDPTLCGFTGAATAASAAKVVNTDCRLGDGKTITLATITDGFSDTTRRIYDKGTVTRPKGTGSVEILVDLWGNGTGHYVAVHEAGNNGITAMRGQPSVAMGDNRAATRLTGVTYVVTRGAIGPGAGVTVAESENTDLDDDSDADDGLARTAAADDMVTVTVTSDSDYCSKDNNHDAMVTVQAEMQTATDANQIIPAVVRNATSGVVGSTTFTVVCPAAVANMGTEVVPDNPFPTDR